MRIGFNGKESLLKAELLHENEVKSNRLTSFSLLLVGLIYIAMFLLYRLGLYDIGIEICADLLLAAGIIGIITYAVARYFKYEKTWIKHLLLIVLLLCFAVIFFFYPFNAAFFAYVPIMIGAMYYDKKIGRRVQLLSWVGYVLLMSANIVLEQKSGAMRSFHAYERVFVWKTPIEVIRYYMIPHTIFFIVAVRICDGISYRGSDLLYRQAQIASEIAGVEAEMKAASKIQLSSIPDTAYVAPNGNLSINAFIRPAKTVGGDFYDYCMLDGIAVILIADVSDKGLSAAMFMMKAKDAIRSAIQKGEPLTLAVHKANELLCRDNAENMFVTAFVAALDPDTGAGKFINCGHIPPFIKRSDGSVIKIECEPGLPLGLFENAEIISHPLMLASGDTLFMFTDGLTDAEDGNGEQFGEERLFKTVSVIQNGEGMCEKLIGAIDSFASGAEQFDDMTALTVRIAKAEKTSRLMLRLMNRPESAAQAIDALNGLLIEKECPEDVRREIDVAMDEVVSNIVDYAYPGMEGALEISAAVARNYVCMEITDTGIPFDPNTVPAPEVLDGPQEGGLGLFFVRKFMDSVEHTYADGKNRLTMLKIWKGSAC